MEAKFYKVLELDKIIDMLKAREFDTCNRRFTIQRLEKP